MLVLCHSLKYTTHSGPKMVPREKNNKPMKKILEYLGFQGLFNKMRGRHKEWGRGHTHKARAGLCVHVHCCFLPLVWGFLLGFLFWFGFFWMSRGRIYLRYWNIAQITHCFCAH